MLSAREVAMSLIANPWRSVDANRLPFATGSSWAGPSGEAGAGAAGAGTEMGVAGGSGSSGGDSGSAMDLDTAHLHQSGYMDPSFSSILTLEEKTRIKQWSNRVWKSTIDQPKEDADGSVLALPPLAVPADISSSSILSSSGLPDFVEDAEEAGIREAVPLR